MGVYLGRNPVEVYGGGVKVKPEEEKTVTASTSVINVVPTEGMAMSKVTVNPTPSEEKTVTAGVSTSDVTPTNGKYLSKVTVNPTPSEEKKAIPTSSQQTVSPSSGKLLSKVTVEGDADLISANIKQGVNIFGVDGKSSVIDTEDTASLKADENFNNLIDSSIGDAIRAKAGTSGTMTLDEMVASIESMKVGATLERGTFRPSSDVKYYNINWSKTYDEVPALFVFAAKSTPYDPSGGYNYYDSGFIVCPRSVISRFLGYTSYKQLANIYKSEANIRDPIYNNATFEWLTTSKCTLGGTSSSSLPYTFYFQNGITYEWVAIWE